MPSDASYAALLQRQDAVAQAFVAALQREHEVLMQPAVAHAALTEIANIKARQAAALEALEQERQAFVRQLRTKNPGAEAQASDAETARELGCGALWQALCVHLAQAGNQNRVNGVAIATRLQSTTERLRFLRRHTSDALYTASGQRQNKRGIGRARGDA